VIRSLLASLFLAFGLSLAALALYIGAQERRSVVNALEDQVRKDAALLAALVPLEEVRANDPARVDAWADRVGRELEHRVTVVAADGRVLGDSRVALERLAGVESHADRPEVRAARSAGAGGAGRDIRRSETTGEEYLYVARALRDPPGAVVRVALPIAGVRGHVAEALRALWALSLGAFAFAVLFALWRTRPAARRLRAFEDVARRIEAGDLSARASEEGRDEVTEVARMVNRMAAGLRSTLDRVEAERDMREEMLSAMTDGVVLLDRSGAIVHSNAALTRALGRPSDPAPGERFATWCRLPELDAFLGEARGGPGARRRELLVRDPAGRSLDAVASRLADGSLLLVVRDLTPLRHLERVRQDFVANVSHELKTPLTSILGYAETLLDGGLEDTARRREFVETIREQATRLQDIVQDLLVLAELERPDAAFATGPVELGRLARSVTGALAPRAEKAGLTLGCACPDGEIVVLGERARLEQMLFNLVDNALKYTEEGGVRLKVHGEDSWAVLEVEDTGPGVPEGAKSRIFERFYRVDAARSRQVPGTGLGLSIVKHIVELHRGRIEVANLPGGGARFTLRLPRLR
jgi:two-component system phosphate regulon sensor histidine kinase PhoR